MLVLLPSQGILGQSRVKLKTPTFSDIREVNNYNVENLLREFKFVDLLSNANLSKITYHDFRYLFSLAAFNVLLNILKFPITCKRCKESYTKQVSLTDLEIKQLDLIKLPYRRYIGGTLYKFNLLSAQNVFDAYTWAQYEENEGQAFEDAKVAYILGIPLEEVDKVRNLPVSVYVGALLFDQVNFHGLVPNVEAVCPKCGTKYKFSFNLNSSALSFSTESLMSRYAGVSSVMNLSDFLSLSVNEFNSLVSEFNRRV